MLILIGLIEKKKIFHQKEMIEIFPNFERERATAKQISSCWKNLNTKKYEILISICLDFLIEQLLSRSNSGIWLLFQETF